MKQDQGRIQSQNEVTAQLNRLPTILNDQSLILPETIAFLLANSIG
jgi:hypothetical protein